MTTLLNQISAIVAGVAGGFAIRVSAAIAATDTAAHDVAHAAAGHAADHGSGGLPQFDPSSFSSQVFWMAVVFAFLYVFFSKKTLPAISSVLENRREQIESDQSTAESLRNQAADVLNAYESSLTDARTQASQLNADAVNDAKSQSEAALKKFQERAESSLSALESRLNGDKAQVMDDMNTIAAEIASAAAEKIVGISTDLDQARSVVQSLNKLSKAA